MYSIKFLIEKEEYDDSIRFLIEKIGSIEYETVNKKKGKIVKINAETFENSEKIKDILKDLAKKISKPQTILESTKDIMPVIKKIQEENESIKPFKNLTILINTHLKEDTGVLIFMLQDLGAKVVVIPVPYSRDPNVFKILNDAKIPIYTKVENSKLISMNMNEMNDYIDKAFQENKINIILEDGAWISKFIVEKNIDTKEIIGSIEQTKAGVTIAKENLNEKINYPILTVGDAPLKETSESETATPEAVVRNIIQSLNCSLMGKIVSIVGFGHVGKGIAQIARNFGARIRIVEKNPTMVLSAINNGFDVITLKEAIRKSDILITATGRPQDNPVPFNVLRDAKDNIILVNAGSKREMDIDGLEKNSVKKEYLLREGITRYYIKNRKNKLKSLLLIAEGYPINLALGEGSPSDSIDITLGLMAEGAIYLSKNKKKIKSGVISLPLEVSNIITQYKLDSIS